MCRSLIRASRQKFFKKLIRFAAQLLKDSKVLTYFRSVRFLSFFLMIEQNLLQSHAVAAQIQVKLHSVCHAKDSWQSLSTPHFVLIRVSRQNFWHCCIVQLTAQNEPIRQSLFRNSFQEEFQMQTPKRHNRMQSRHKFR